LYGLLRGAATVSVRVWPTLTTQVVYLACRAAVLLLLLLLTSLSEAVTPNADQKSRKVAQISFLTCGPKVVQNQQCGDKIKHYQLTS